MKSESISRSAMSDSLQPRRLQPTGSSGHGILQARILGWVAIPFSRGSSRPRDGTGSPAFQAILYCLSHQGSPEGHGRGCPKAAPTFPGVCPYSSQYRNTHSTESQGAYQATQKHPHAHCSQVGHRRFRRTRGHLTGPE